MVESYRLHGSYLFDAAPLEEMIAFFAEYETVYIWKKPKRCLTAGRHYPSKVLPKHAAFRIVRFTAFSRNVTTSAHPNTAKSQIIKSKRLLLVQAYQR